MKDIKDFTEEEKLKKLFKDVPIEKYYDFENDVMDEIAYHKDFKNEFYKLFGNKELNDESATVKRQRLFCKIDVTLLHKDDAELSEFELKKKKEHQKWHDEYFLIKREKQARDKGEISDATLQLGSEGIINELSGIQDNSFHGKRAEQEADKLRKALQNITL